MVVFSVSLQLRPPLHRQGPPRRPALQVPCGHTGGALQGEAGDTVALLTTGVLLMLEKANGANQASCMDPCVLSMYDAAQYSWCTTAR